jgi:DNA-binding CsgD family transcriptional regulator
MTLLERHTQLAELAAAERDAAAGQGSVVVITGAAGMGKTALVDEFTRRSAARVLLGLCDDLLTPRPLGPFRDMFAHRGEQPDFGSFLDAVLTDLESPPHPAIAVVEDAHWADQASLDTVRFLGRRIGRMRAMLVLTYRDDEVPADHPLRLTLGAVPAADTRRVRLRPLSRHAVARLAGRTDVDGLYEVTGGNPFFVREVLEAPDARVPATIQDALMARVSRMEPAAVACTEVASVVPGRAELWLLAGCGVASGIDSAVRGGVLSVHGESVTFANELARRAVEDSLAAGRRAEINQRVLDVLVQHGGVEPARLTHHATQAKDAAAVAAYAPVAARRAAVLQSHRAAAAHYEQALSVPEQFTTGEVAELLEQYAAVCRVLADHEAALTAIRRSLELTGDREAELRGRRLCLLSELLMLVGRRSAAEEAAAAATAALDGAKPGSALADAYAQRARLVMIIGRAREAVHWGERARALAASLDDAKALAHIDVTLGMARWQLDADDWRYLAEALERCRAAGIVYAAARAYVNLAHGNTQLMRYADAARYIAEGLAYCEESDHLLDFGYLLVSSAQRHFEQGRWHEAEQEVHRALDVVGVGHTRLSGLWIRGLIQARRGDPEAASTISQAIQFADESGDPEGRLRAWAAQAEFDHINGSSGAVERAAEVIPLLEEAGPWSRGLADSALWLSRTGLLAEPPSRVTGPRALQLTGAWRDAADEFEALGRPYDMADALSAADEPEPLLEAVDILNRLGAAARAATVREQLAGMGVAHVPRGPRETTRSNPAGLTPRQTEVLSLLATDLTYQQIAERLHVSVKTVDHHVTAVRAKLAVRSREDAVAAGRRLGIVPAEDRELKPLT